MKKILVMSLVCVAAFAGIAAAMKCPITGKPHMKREGMESCCPMHHKMIKAMMLQRELVPTSDGGVVLLHGKTLTKYDSSLAVQKEVEIKCDPEAMKKMVEEMRASCPMCKKACEKGGKGWQEEHEEHEK